jgi:hypothetical protein
MMIVMIIFAVMKGGGYIAYYEPNFTILAVEVVWGLFALIVAFNDMITIALGGDLFDSA